MPGVPTVAVADVPDPLPVGVVMLDVREDDEWAAGHVEGSVHVPLSALPAAADRIPSEAPLLVVCKVGGRSAQVTMWLASQGRDVVSLGGGLLAWQRAGRSLVSDSGTPGVVA